jgi:hypothetical protein
LDPLPWIQPQVSLTESILSIGKFVEEKNRDELFQQKVQNCFIKCGQWYDSEDDLSFKTFDMARLMLGADNVQIFGNDEDACVINKTITRQGDNLTFVPLELTELVELELPDRNDEEDYDFYDDEDPLNDQTNTSSSTSAITASREVIVATVNETARNVVDTIPILTDAEIDVLGSEAEGVAKIKKAMQLRGDMRRSGFTKKNLPDLVQELKSIEETRRRAAPAPAPPAPVALPAPTAPVPPAPVPPALVPPALVVPAVPVQRQYYCLPRCKCPLEGDADKEMIECENKDNCPHGQWYHFKCLKLLKTAKTGTWYCACCEMSM